MSISSALASAVTGLNAQSRASQVVSSNVANATNEAYARREIQLSGRQGGGVGVDGIQRVVDETVLRDRRLADAETGAAAATRDFYADVERILGQPGESGALTGRVDAFDSALISAAATPDSEVRLGQVLDRAKALAEGLNRASEGVQSLRADADTGIARGVEKLNAGLAEVADLNGKILRAGSSGQQTAALEDHRQKVVDDLADLVPMQSYRRDNGSIALYTKTGARLVESGAVRVGFTPAAAVTPETTQQAGGLSGLTLDGREVDVARPDGPLAGGRLAAMFALRDDAAVTVQADLDAVARDLMSRLADPAVDPSLPAGGPGLFTDGGAAFDPAREVGLSKRLSISGAVDPAVGGAVHRLRDGLGAAAPGPAGDGSLLGAMADALADTRVAASGGFGTSTHDVHGLTSAILSGAGVARQSAETTSSWAEANRDALVQAERADGVDTDQQMQKLLTIERAYAANARVIQTAGQMIDRIMDL